jgi:CubicO group peptidase (beta-lactamase class C family)
MFRFYLKKYKIIAFGTLLLLTGFAACEKESIADPVSSASIEEFETRLDHLRLEAKIPGMAAGIVRNGQVEWTKSFGYENIAQQKLVTDTTIFHLASLTKTFASTVIVRLASENKINLNAPVSNYGINLPNQGGIVRVIHLLTHTSIGPPGSLFLYSGDRFALLSIVIKSATGESFDKVAADQIMHPLDLPNTAPRDMQLAAINGFDTIGLKQNTAQGYSSDGIHEVDYPLNFSTAAGLISNIDDMLKYVSAFDGNLLLSDSLKEIVFSPMISTSGKTLPYGLGWFIQNKEHIKICWHYGYWTGMSSLMIRVPEKNLSFVLLANSDMLSSPYPLSKGDIWVSPYAKEFLKSFVLAGAKL